MAGRAVDMARLMALMPEIDVNAPRVRLGLGWAASTALALAVGPLALAVWLAGFAGAATAQACRTWSGQPGRPRRELALAGALLPLAAAAGPLAFGAGAVVLGVATFAVLVDDKDRLNATLAIALLCGAGPAALVVVARDVGTVAAAVLLVTVFVYDASVFVVGSGANHRWEGVVAGIASIGSVTLAVAAGLVPSFRGLSPWILGALAVCTAPLGPMVASAILGRRPSRVPALRRIDSLLVLGPVWATAAAWLTG